jgi:uncharacterized membrane protein
MNTATSMSDSRTASLVGWSNLIYALHALSIVIGIIGVSTVVGSFLIGWPSIIAVVITYVKRGDADGTWLASHFTWQLRTFWYGALWFGLSVVFVVLTLGVGLLLVWIPLAILTIWFIYRVARGWSSLANRRPMYR